MGVIHKCTFKNPAMHVPLTGNCSFPKEITTQCAKIRVYLSLLIVVKYWELPVTYEGLLIKELPK